MRVLIADDEPKVVQLIQGLIDWDALEIEIVGKAYNGLEALALIDELHPDLVITDIRMPGYDGLELISRAKAVQAHLDFIIISGYRHFEYAQSAIKYGVSDYLLKPIKREELTATLLRIREKHRQREERLSEEERLKLRLQSDLDKLRAGLFADLLQGQSPSAQSIEQLNQSYHYHFCAGMFQAFIVKMDCPYASVQQGGMQLLEEKAGRILRGLLERPCFDMELCFRGSRAYGLLNFAPDRADLVRRQLRAAVDELSMRSSVFQDAVFTIGLGSRSERPDQLRHALVLAEEGVKQRLCEGSGRLIEAIPALDGQISGVLEVYKKQMVGALERLDPGEASAAAQELARQALAETSFTGQALFSLTVQAFGEYMLLLRTLHLEEDGAQILAGTFAEQADLCSTGRDLFNCLVRTVRASAEQVASARRQLDKKPIRDAKQYIQQHYMEQINLEQVSGIVGFNAAYFSSLFKKESGQNFVEYLSEVRMDQAKELLRNTNMNVAAVCEQVGYSDLRHFTQLFKKHTGLKPNEFRKLYA